MVSENTFFGHRAFTLENGGLSLRVTEYGATILSLKKDGKELVVSFDDIEKYERSGSYLGAIVGRYANRISGASFDIGGERFALDANERGNTLHGGNDGGPWNKRDWHGERAGDDAVAFTLLSPDGDNGFPGELRAGVIYTLLPDRLRIDFSGVSDRDTYYAPTSHVYFSLGLGDIRDATMQMDSDAHLEMGEGLIPTGRLLGNAGDFNFSKPRRIARDFDDCFTLRSGRFCTAEGDGVRLSLYTDYPAVQFYTGAFLDCGLAPNAGFAIEPEFYPDSPNRPEFPSALLRAGEKFSKYLEFVIE